MKSILVLTFLCAMPCFAESEEVTTELSCEEIVVKHQKLKDAFVEIDDAFVKPIGWIDSLTLFNFDITNMEAKYKEMECSNEIELFESRYF